MMVTFAIEVPDGEDVAAAEAQLIATAERWVLLSALSFVPMPPVVVERTQVPRFVPTGKMVDRGFVNLEVETVLTTVTLLEAKVEVDE